MDQYICAICKKAVDINTFEYCERCGSTQITVWSPYNEIPRVIERGLPSMFQYGEWQDQLQPMLNQDGVYVFNVRMYHERHATTYKAITDLWLVPAIKFLLEKCSGGIAVKAYEHEQSDQAREGVNFIGSPNGTTALDFMGYGPSSTVRVSRFLALWELGWTMEGFEEGEHDDAYSNGNPFCLMANNILIDSHSLTWWMIEQEG